MTILYLGRFLKEYKKLPKELKLLAEERERVFRINPFDSRLNTHKLHGPLRDFWAFSINRRFRIIFDFSGKNTVRFYSVGDHDIYEI